MRVVTPDAVAQASGSKYLGVLVAAKFARHLNEFRRGEILENPEIAGKREKLTTTALEAAAADAIPYRLVDRRGPGF